MAQNILDLSLADFRATVDEMQANGSNTDEIVRQYRAKNSVFSPINNAADAYQRDLAGAGRRPVLGGLLSKEIGTTGMDALRSIDFEGMGGLLGMGKAIGQTLDAPAAAAQGLIPQADMSAEALGTAGLAMGAGGAVTAPGGALRSGLARDGKINQVKIGNTNVAYSLGSDGVAEISSVRTPTSKRGQGSARSAVQSVVSELQDAGATSVRLIPSPLDKKTSPALLEKFYESMGFSRTGQVANMAGDEYMSKALTANSSASGGLLGAGLSEAQRVARDVLEMRAAGRAGEVTDDMMARADPQYMYDNTPLPMDEASRMARAQEAGLGGDLYHSSLQDMVQAKPVGTFMGYTGTSGFSATDVPDAASRYLDRFGEYGFVDGVPNQPFAKNVMPLKGRLGIVDERQSPYPSALSLGSPLPDGYTPEHVRRGFDTATFKDSVSRGGPVKHSGAKNAIRSTEYVISGPQNLRSRFARFDPEFAHLSNLSAANASPTAGLLASGAQEQDKPLPFMELLRGLLR
jgi:hypothetical protein